MTARRRMPLLIAAAIGWVAHDMVGNARPVPSIALAVIVGLAIALGRSLTKAEQIIDESTTEAAR